MNTIAGAVLLLLLVVAFNAYRQGELSAWFRAKFQNQGP